MSCGSVVAEVVAALKPAAALKGLSFGTLLTNAAIVVRTDRRALHQILLNLAGNAIKFTDRGGVRIAITGPRQNGDASVRLSVTDTGIGIRPQDKPRLFEAFEQLEGTGPRRHEGSGLGLHLSQKLAQLLGARIECESEWGRGSTFTLVLPELL